MRMRMRQVFRRVLLAREWVAPRGNIRGRRSGRRLGRRPTRVPNRSSAAMGLRLLAEGHGRVKRAVAVVGLASHRSVVVVAGEEDEAEAEEEGREVSAEAVGEEVEVPEVDEVLTGVWMIVRSLGMAMLEGCSTRSFCSLAWWRRSHVCTGPEG
jgi:hypothetical protein